MKRLNSYITFFRECPVGQGSTGRFRSDCLRFGGDAVGRVGVSGGGGTRPRLVVRLEVLEELELVGQQLAADFAGEGRRLLRGRGVRGAVRGVRRLRPELLATLVALVTLRVDAATTTHTFRLGSLRWGGIALDLD